MNFTGRERELQQPAEMFLRVFGWYRSVYEHEETEAEERITGTGMSRWNNHWTSLRAKSSCSLQPEWKVLRNHRALGRVLVRLLPWQCPHTMRAALDPPSKA